MKYLKTMNRNLTLNTEILLVVVVGRVESVVVLQKLDTVIVGMAVLNEYKKERFSTTRRRVCLL